jgi:hypothetical protein
LASAKCEEPYRWCHTDGPRHAFGGSTRQTIARFEVRPFLRFWLSSLAGFSWDVTRYFEGRAFALAYRPEWGTAESTFKLFTDRKSASKQFSDHPVKDINNTEANPFQFQTLRRWLFAEIDMHNMNLPAGRSNTSVYAATWAHRGLLRFRAFAQGCDLFMGLPPQWHQRAGGWLSHIPRLIDRLASRPRRAYASIHDAGLLGRHAAAHSQLEGQLTSSRSRPAKSLQRLWGSQATVCSGP